MICLARHYGLRRKSGILPLEESWDYFLTTEITGVCSIKTHFREEAINFSKWFNDQLLPNIPENALIILDNAKYHNVLVEGFFPSACSTKPQLQQWLDKHGFKWQESMLKSELLEYSKRFVSEPEFRLDSMVSNKGVRLLRTPPYHPELQPIEICWAVVKNYMADHCDFTMKGLYERLPNAFAKVTGKTCEKIIEKVRTVEDNFWNEDEKLDEIYMSDACDELKISAGSESEAADPYLGETEQLLR